MMHILFFILKLIGILLLVVIGLILLIIGIVSFVPVRYRISGEKYESIKADVAVTWLFSLIGFDLTFDTGADEKMDMDLRIGPVHPLKKKPAGKTKVKSEDKPVETACEADVRIVQTELKETPSESEVVDKQNVYVDEETVKIVPIRTESVHKQEDGSFKSGTSGVGSPQGDSPIYASPEDQVPVLTIGAEDKAKAKEKGSFFDGLIKKAEDLYDKIRGILDKVYEKAVFAREKKDQVMAVLDLPGMKPYLLKTLFRLKKALLHYIPKIESISLKIGQKDPADTGKILGYLMFANGILGERMQIEGDFENNVLEGEGRIKGHLRLCHILAFALCTVLNVHFFKLLKQIKRII